MNSQLKKGFTLVELLVSVTLLAILAVIIIINLNGNFKKQQEKEYAEFIDKVKSAANVYLAANPSSEILAKDEEGYNIISIERLADTGLIDMDTLIDPETKLPLSDENTVDAKKYIKIYDDEKQENSEKSDATLIQYPAEGEIANYERKIRYEMNGFGTCEEQKRVVGEKVTICNPSDENADFESWYLDKELTEKGPSKGSEYIAKENMIFYAKWNKNKSANITNVKIESATENYKDYIVKISMTITDPYGGTIKICINNTSNMNECEKWTTKEIAKEGITYSEEIDLSKYNSANERGSGKKETMYIYVLNTAYEEAIKENREANSLIAMKNEDYEIYKYCNETTVTKYGQYSACNKKCGSGTQSRTNKVKDKYYSSYACPNKIETQTCNTQDCCSSTTQTTTSWGSCSASCGGGTQKRTITLKSTYTGQICSTKDEYQSCNTQDCCSSTKAVYGSWGSCSASCGGGTQTRNVTYKSTYNGEVCYTEQETQNCNTQSCCNYTYCQPTGGSYNGQPTYFACGNCGCSTSPNFASDLKRAFGLDCTGGGAGGGTGGGAVSCDSGFDTCDGTCCCKMYWQGEDYWCNGTIIKREIRYCSGRANNECALCLAASYCP